MPVLNLYSYDIFVVFGGSSTEYAYNTEFSGWAAMLANKYIRRIDVLNRGFCGYNSRWAKTIFLNMFPKTKNNSFRTNQITNGIHEMNGDSSVGKSACERKLMEHLKTNRPAQVKLIIIFLGVNDAVLEQCSSHVPLGEFHQNLLSMIDHLADPNSEYYSPETKFVLITPPPVCEPAWRVTAEKRKLSSVRCEKKSKLYAEEVIKVGKKRNIPVVDVFTRIKTEINEIQAKQAEINVLTNGTTSTGSKMVEDNLRWFGYDQFFYDGLHFNANGSKIMFEMLYDTIITNYPDLAPKKLPIYFPLAAEIQHS
ncbi:hypothetical protein BB560_003017 [Smittium megazygosporum]|uniref:SGNH hydrolase-type esterase domain-containing protein n=1 Tax=Smittium megazygosporum TaxID=133381 RepID=A0A2T9ZDA3_9FUNG|nr:hypothetical protein BB560_003017 [Smittium megazygosporum]